MPERVQHCISGREKSEDVRHDVLGSGKLRQGDGAQGRATAAPERCSWPALASRCPSPWTRSWSHCCPWAPPGRLGARRFTRLLGALGIARPEQPKLFLLPKVSSVEYRDCWLGRSVDGTPSRPPGVARLLYDDPSGLRRPWPYQTSLAPSSEHPTCEQSRRCGQTDFRLRMELATLSEGLASLAQSPHAIRYLSRIYAFILAWGGMPPMPCRLLVPACRTVSISPSVVGCHKKNLSSSTPHAPTSVPTILPFAGAPPSEPSFSPVRSVGKLQAEAASLALNSISKRQ